MLLLLWASALNFQDEIIGPFGGNQSGNIAAREIRKQQQPTLLPLLRDDEEWLILHVTRNTQP